MERVSNAFNLTSNPSPEFNLLLNKLKQKASISGKDLRKMLQCQEAFVIHYQESSKCQTRIQASQDSDFIAKSQIENFLHDSTIQKLTEELIDLRMKLIEEFQYTFANLKEIQERLLYTEITKWKRAQQLVGNGKPFLNNIDQIQEWCEHLADIIWQKRQQIIQVQTLVSQFPLNIPTYVMEKLTDLNNQYTNLLSFLVTSSFIIEKQPPQVLRIDTRFAVTMRLLFGSKLSVYKTPSEVKVTIISEAQAMEIIKNGQIGTGNTSGNILNDTSTMEYDQDRRKLSVKFRNLQLKKIKRSEKKELQSVMDEKFSLLFQSQFKVAGGELIFRTWTLSLPVVIIAHGNQDPHAWATITWDNAFSELGRLPFQVQLKASWQDIADVLNTKFKAITGCSLSKNNLKFLAGKLFRNLRFVEPSSMVTWSQFCKELLPERNFTFWEWFYAAMKVTREHLKTLWKEGLTIGFIGRDQAEELLLKKCTGTFLIRFSDSEPGGVTFAWVTDSWTKVDIVLTKYLMTKKTRNEWREVLMIQPFTSKDFAIRPLADRILDLKNLQFLYPDIPKDRAFQKHYSIHPGDFDENGYVRSMLVTYLPA